MKKQAIKKRLSLFLFLTLVEFPLSSQDLIPYPASKTDTITDLYFDRSIRDPFRWLENVSDSSVIKWVDAQNKYTNSCLLKVPCYAKIEKNIHDNIGYSIDFPESDEKYSLELFSYGKNSGKAHYKNYNPILWYKTKFEDWKELVNPLTYRSAPNDNVLITDFELSPDNTYLFFSLSRNGSDWEEIRTLDMKTKKVIGEPVNWVKFGDVMWYENGFFYQRFDAPEEGQNLTALNTNYSLFYHRTGEPQANDIEIKVNGFSYADLMKDKLVLYHVLKKNQTSYNVVSYLNLDKARIIQDAPKPFIIYPNKRDYNVEVVCVNRDSAVVKTNLHASNGMLALYHLNELNRFDTLVKEYSEVLTRAYFYRKKIVCLYEKDSRVSMVKFNTRGDKEAVHMFPAFSSLHFRFPRNEKNIYYFETSFDRPSVLYQFYFETFTSSLVEPTVVSYVPRSYETKLVDYQASDGVKIPMTLFYKKGTKLDGNNPVLLTAYGGFNILERPSYSFSTLLWTENNGIYAVAHIRGGGEKGKKWHFAGSGLNKQRSVDDFVDAAKFLVDNHYTTRERLVSKGASNGGMVVSAAAMRRPDLFRAVVADVGVYDMLRYQNFTVGNHWEEEYGLSCDSLEFNSLISYSPLHNVHDSVQYPAMLLITNDHDDRVPPFHTYKYAARLQQNRKSKNPILLYVGKNAGHSGWVNGNDRYKETVVTLSFLFSTLGIEPKLMD